MYSSGLNCTASDPSGFKTYQQQPSRQKAHRSIQAKHPFLTEEDWQPEKEGKTKVKRPQRRSSPLEWHLFGKTFGSADIPRC